MHHLIDKSELVQNVNDNNTQMKGLRAWDGSSFSGIFRNDIPKSKNQIGGVDIYTVKKGKKHGLLAAVRGKDKPNIFMIYEQDKLIE